MSFDAHSLERLRQLGRQLPQPLPRPQPPSGTEPLPARRAGPLHPLETEQDPDQLFRELIKASADGTVPPHLLQRLKEQETRRQEQRLQERRQERRQEQPPAPGQGQGPARAKPQGRGLTGRPDPRAATEHPELYSEFHQLLLETDEED
jgi:hypothetical protein